MAQTDHDSSDFATLQRLADERWSCRQFTAEQVDRATIEQLLTLAQRTPSWCNTQPWQVVVTAGEGTQRFRKE
ncbi:nitroreductase family protein, partial [Nocardia sp. NPDC060220]